MFFLHLVSSITLSDWVPIPLFLYFSHASFSLWNHACVSCDCWLVTIVSFLLRIERAHFWSSLQARCAKLSVQRHFTVLWQDHATYIQGVYVLLLQPCPNVKKARMLAMLWSVNGRYVRFLLHTIRSMAWCDSQLTIAWYCKLDTSHFVQIK